MRRVTVVGTTGSGKTTLARALAERLGVPHVEMDALHWGPNWTAAPKPELRARVEAALAGDGWVVDGNYRAVRDIVWARADTLVWLDYPLPLVMTRLVRRTLGRAFRRERLWNDNRENLVTHFFRRDSLFLWAVQTHPRHRREYPIELSQPEYQHLAVARLRSPRETQRWLEGVSP